MEPAYLDGSFAVFDKFDESKLSRNLVVAFQSPSSWKYSNNLYIKRVVGLPGDIVAIKNNTLFVNEKEITKIDGDNIEDRSLSICSGCFFALGDNHKASIDSLSYLLKEGTEQVFVPIQNIRYIEKITKGGERIDRKQQ